MSQRDFEAFNPYSAPLTGPESSDPFQQDDTRIFQLQSFRPSARIWAIVFCSLWLLFVPVGTFFGSACLWYLARPAAKYVFTPEYLEVIRRTPHVQFRTSGASWGILVIVLLAIIGLMVAVSFRL